MRSFKTFEKGVGDVTGGYVHAYLDDVIPECFAVFCKFDRGDIYSNEAYVVFLPDSTFVGFYSQVQGSLSTHGGQYGINMALFEDLDDAIYREGEQIDMVCRHGIGHDRGGVAVDEADFDTFFPQGAGGLCARVIKFARLSYDDGSATDDQYRADTTIFGHLPVGFDKDDGAGPLKNRTKIRFAKKADLPE